MTWRDLKWLKETQSNLKSLKETQCSDFENKLENNTVFHTQNPCLNAESLKQMSIVEDLLRKVDE